MTLPRLTCRTSCRIAAAALAITCGLSAAVPRVQAQPALPPAPMPDAPPAPGDDEVEVLTRGPVHEAFAEQFNTDPQPGLTVPREPPADIEEMVPETIPDGDNVQWIKGYWAWDDETENFIWISGFWRDIPVGQRWIPGYWHHVAAGYQWVSGFWITEQVAELDYLPQPPASLEVGPSTPSPSDNHFWVPGCWMYVGATYHWRPGFWSPCYDDWVWVPDRYVWTPFGFVYRPGYYDRLLSARGCLFAPVRFAHVHYWHRPRVFFTPTYVIDTGPLALHLFVRPTYCHYYFGDFYAAHYSGWGFRPWYTCDFRYRSTYCYDPLLVFYVGYHRRHGRIDYCDRLASWNRHYRDHAHHRPPRTARDFDRFVASHGHDRDRDFVKNAALGRKLDDVVKEPRGDRKFRTITAVERTEKVKVASNSRELARMRKELESDGGGRRSRLPAGQIQTEHGVGAGPNVAERSGSERESKSRKLKLPKSDSGTMAHAAQPRNRLPETPGGSKSDKVSKGDNHAPGGGNTADDSRRSRRTTVTPRGGGNQSGNSLPGGGAPIGGTTRGGGKTPDGDKKDKPDDKEKGSSRNAPTPRIVPRNIEAQPGGGASNQGSSGISPRRGSGGGSSGAGDQNPANVSPPRIESNRGGNPSGSRSGSSGSGGSSSGSGKKEKRSGSSGTSGAMSSGSASPGNFGSIQGRASRPSQSATSGGSSSGSRSSRSFVGSASRGGSTGTSGAMSSGRSGSSQNGNIRSSQSSKPGSSASSFRSSRSSSSSASRGGNSGGGGGSSDGGSKKKKDR